MKGECFLGVGQSERGIKDGAYVWCACAVLAVLGLLMPLSAAAVSEVMLYAKKIEIDQIVLHEAEVQLALAKESHLRVATHRIDVGQSTLRQATVDVTIESPSKSQALIHAKTLETPILDVQNPLIQLTRLGDAEPSTFRLQADVKQVDDKQWGTFQLTCILPSTAFVDAWKCNDGLYRTEHANIPFALDLTPLQNGAEAEVRFKQANFSDATGLHAGENITGKLRLGAQFRASQVDWQGLIDWESGELFWQPFYIAQSGHRFEVAGSYQAPYLDIASAKLQMKGVGELQTDARINLTNKQFERLNVQGKHVDFAGLYPMLIQPLLQKTAFGNLAVSGLADWSFHVEQGLPQTFHLTIADATLEDKAGKFGFQHFNADIPWDYNHPQQISVGYQSGHLLKIPLGETRWNAEVNRFSITTPALNLPVLDGALRFEDVSAAWINQQMVWHLQMQLQPISMNSFSQALGWPPMRGTIDGNIPLMTYANEQLVMQGDMQFNLFNGLIGMSDLQIKQPLGAHPELFANLRMRDIDLGEITRTFNFGSIEGKLEGDVRALTLKNWKAVYMDAMIQTADGQHDKVISQRAVENITALGGEGTAAALQRTFLRFFKAFKYEKIGLGCELRGDICRMSGVETTPTGFVIVKGKGAPSVNVNGYTKYVSWKDLLARMERITDGNTKAIVK